MHMLGFSTELQNAEVSLILLKSDSTTDALPAILKFLRTNKETLVMESVFGIVIGGRIGQFKFFKRNAIKNFIYYFPKLS